MKAATTSRFQSCTSAASRQRSARRRSMSSSRRSIREGRLGMNESVGPASDGVRFPALYDRPTVPEAPLEQSEVGLYLAGEGWFVLNSREALWVESEGRGATLPYEARTDFPQIGIRLYVLSPGEPMAMYHWEADQEDFLVLSGEPLLIVEGQERPCGNGTSCTAPSGR